MNWQAILEDFIRSLEEWDRTHPNRWYAYYLAGLREEDKQELGDLLRASVKSQAGKYQALVNEINSWDEDWKLE